MRKLFLVLFLVFFPICGQNPYTNGVWPNSVITDTQIYVASFNANSSLAFAMTANQSTIVLTSQSTFLVGNLIRIDNEKMVITASNGAVAGGFSYNVTRGADFTIAVIHNQGAGVNNQIASGYSNREAREIQAIETDLLTPYQSTITAQTSVTVNAATHLKGIYAWALCFDNSVPRVIKSCTYTRDSSGNLVFSFNPAFTGIVEIRR